MASIRRISNYNPVLANNSKVTRLTNPFEIYKCELQKLVDSLLYKPVDFKFANKDITDTILFPARLSQVLAKQAIGMVKSIQNKINLAKKAGNKQKYQQEIIDAYHSGNMKIDVKSINIELDSRFVDIQPTVDTKICDYWIKITSFPNGTFYVPLKLTRHMKLLQQRGFVLKHDSLRINASGTIGLYFNREYTKPIIPVNPTITGVDVGRNKVIVCSNGKQESTHFTGKKMKQLLAQLQPMNQKSKNFKQLRTNIKHQINYSLKHDIDWNNIDVLVIENLNDMKRYAKWGKKSQFWRVGYIQQRITDLCEENNVWLTRINPAFTSIDCSKCGHRHVNNRSSEKFRCLDCEMEMDADLNAAINIRNRGANSPSVKKYLKSTIYDL